MTSVNITTESGDIQHPGWILWLMRSWSSVLALIHHIITEAADKGVDIAARAIGLSAPLPNSVSVFKVSQLALGFNGWQAFSFAFTLEVVIFAIIEIALMMWNGYLKDKDRYKVPLIAIASVAIVAVAVVMVLVYRIEVVHGGNEILAILPLISVCAFVAIGLKRWHEQNEISDITKPTKKRKKVGKISEISKDSGPSNIEIMNAAKAEKILKRQQEISHIVIENSPISVSEIAKLLSVEVSTKTITSDLEKIADKAGLKKAGKYWQVKQLVVEMAESSANGIVH